MKITKSRAKWLLGLLAAIISAVIGYLSTSCSTTTGLHITADEISNPSIHYTDSTSFSNPLKNK